MARNEEKQLARLNRYYLEKQKQDELKKRPPRPRLDTLNTSREIRKWLPTITRDIDFYVKQMEVPCYTDSKVQEFSDRIQRLKQEYRAYLHKLRALEPDSSAASWSNRPYANRKRQAGNTATEEIKDTEDSNDPEGKASLSPSKIQKFVPISTPVLQNMPSIVHQPGFEKPAPVIWNANPDTQDLPLQFGTPKTLAISHSAFNTDDTDCVSKTGSKSVTQCNDGSADDSRNFCDSLSSEGANFSQVKSVSVDVPETLKFPCSRLGDSKTDSKVGKTWDQSEGSVVDVAASHTLNRKVNSALPDAAPASRAATQSKHLSSGNLLNLDYSDSSDENS